MSGNEPVIPGEVPVFTGNEEELDAKVKALSGHGLKVSTAAGDIHSAFGGLRAFYRAPEAEQLFATTKPVADKGLDLSSDMCVIAGALGTYASTIRPLVKRLDDLRAQAVTFRERIAGDDEWREDGDLIDENLERRNAIAEVWAQFQEAERSCHAKIVALVGGEPLKVNDGSNGKGMYGYDAEALKQSESLPWGDAVQESIPWYHIHEHAWEFGKGVIVDGVWGTIKGLGTLVGFDGWDAAGQAWTGLGKLLTGVVITAIPGVGAAYWAMPEDKLPAWLRDSRTAVKETGKALLAWDKWGSNPSRAAGEVTFNVLTTVFTGGAGGAVAGAGKAGAVARTLSLAGKAGKAVDPMTYLSKGAGAGVVKIGDIMTGLKGAGALDIPSINLDGALALPDGARVLPDGTLDLPSGTPVPDGALKLPDGTVRLPEGTATLPPGTVTLPVDGPARFMDPKGHLYDADGTLVQRAEDAPREAEPPTGANAPHTTAPKPDTPATAAVPEREPAAVGARGNDDVLRLGSDTPDPLHRPADNTPTARPDTTPGGTAPEGMPGNSADRNTPDGGTADTGLRDGTSTGDSGGEAWNGPDTPLPGGGTADTMPPQGQPPVAEPPNGGGRTGSNVDPSWSADLPSRVNEPLPELSTQERADHWLHLDEVEQRSPADFDHLQRDPDKNGGISEPSKDEARVGLDLREQGRVPADIQRPAEPDRGEFYSPSTGRYYDIKGVHSDWPPFNNVRDKSQPFRGAYDPANNGRWVRKLEEQIVDKERTVILDVRNANQAAIDDIRSIVEKNGWENNVIWYP
ncbi:hypothetical protein BJP40_31125 [Streptomyces sp. CC53]|uniref:hypothetical protein n=1 Tax=unclassified Streptomyces TaxID=2593676 RepID=UPI0008DDE191|nr:MULTISPECIES: hypothetical protein [unclassified Streptomyces]OII61655.1 hypothetical protein BJP40_31125 [Streptomyces sp. CC53]